MVKSTTAKRLEIAGKPALQQEVHFDLSNIPGAEANHAVFDEMLGVGGTMVGYFVAADEHTVLVGLGVSQERMAAALDVLKQPKKSLAEDADVSVTAAMFPAGSQWVAYVSPRGFMQLIHRTVAAAMKNEMEAMGISLPQFPSCPPIGFAVKATPDELHAEIVVPASFIESAGEYIKDVQKMIMDRAGQPNPDARAVIAASWLSDELAALDRAGLRRRLSARQGGQAAKIVLDGQELINFGSNDYLALAADPRLAAAAIAAIQSEGLGSGASPLVTGRIRTHQRLGTAAGGVRGHRGGAGVSLRALPPTWPPSPPWPGPATWSSATPRTMPASGTAAGSPGPTSAPTRMPIGGGSMRCWPGLRAIAAA